MIYGMGVDLVELDRMAGSWHKFGEKLARRILHGLEWDEFSRNPRPERYLAKRWAAKEAFAKAMGTGFGCGIYMRDVRISHNGAGQPQLACDGAAHKWLCQRNARCHLSLSDERSMVCAVVLITSE